MTKPQRARSASRRAILLLALLFSITGAAVLPAPQPAAAHPLGNFTVNRYARIELYAGEIRIFYVIDFAEIPAFQELGAIDANNDGVSPDELQAFADRTATELAAGLALGVDGEPLTAIPVLQAASTQLGQGNLLVIRFEALYSALIDETLGARGDLPVSFVDTNYDERVGWRELVFAPSMGTAAGIPPGYADRSNELRAYPASGLAEAPDEQDVRFTWDPATGAPAPTPSLVPSEGAARPAGGFAGLIRGDASAGALVLALAAAFGFGMMHALGPGHGKTVVAAYLVGSRGTPAQALLLGLTVTATHTSTVYLLGFITLAASAYVMPDQLYLYLSLLSGVLVAVFGAAVLARRFGAWQRAAQGDALHRHAPWLPAHSHAGAADHAASITGHDHATRPDAAGVVPGSASRLRGRSLIALGVIGGLLPCPSAIVVMLAAISLDRVALGMLLIVAFSAGLAAVLVAVGLAVVLAGRMSGGPLRFVASHAALRAGVAAVPVLAALVITIAGLALTYRAWAGIPI